MAAVAAAKTPVKNNSEQTVVVVVLTRVKEDIKAAKPLVVRILKPGKWFSLKRTSEEEDQDEEEEERQWHGYICLASQAFRLNTWVSFDAAAVWAARSAEVRADQTGALQLVPLQKKLDEIVKWKNPFKHVTSIISRSPDADVTIVIIDKAKEEGEASSLVFVRNVVAGSKSEVNVKSIFGDKLERVKELHAYMMFTPYVFDFDKWVSFPAKMLTDGDFILFPSKIEPTMVAHRSKKRNRVVKLRGVTWARANFTA